MSLFNLFKKEDKKEELCLGEIYCACFRGMSISCFCPINTSCGPGQRVTLGFHNIYRWSIDGLSNNKIKFWGSWYSLNDVVFAEDKDKDKKKARIIKKYEKQLKVVRENNRWCAEKETEIVCGGMLR